MDRFVAMTTLLAVVDQGSLSAAGRSLHVPLATISRRITDLETLLGARLLIRTTRRLTLTDAGTTYLTAARRIVAQVREAEQEATGEFRTPRGDLVLTAPVAFGRLFVLPVVAEFLAEFPEINIRLVLADRNVDLVDDQVDMAVRIGKLPDSTLVATRVGSMRMVTCASPALLAAQGAPKTPHALVKFPCVSMDATPSTAVWQFRSPNKGASIRVPIVPRLTVTTAEAAADAAVRDVGITRLLHYQVADALKSAGLRLVLETFEPEPMPVHLLHAERAHLPLKMRRFIDFAASRLREMLSPRR